MDEASKRREAADELADWFRLVSIYEYKNEEDVSGLLRPAARTIVSLVIDAAKEEMRAEIGAIAVPPYKPSIEPEQAMQGWDAKADDLNARVIISLARALASHTGMSAGFIVREHTRRAQAAQDASQDGAAAPVEDAAVWACRACLAANVAGAAKCWKCGISEQGPECGKPAAAPPCPPPAPAPVALVLECWRCRKTMEVSPIYGPLIRFCPECRQMARVRAPKPGDKPDATLPSSAAPVLFDS